MKLKKPTKAQLRVLSALEQEFAVERRCYVSTSPGTMSFNHRWVIESPGIVGNNVRPVHHATVYACEKQGWVCRGPSERDPKITSLKLLPAGRVFV